MEKKKLPTEGERAGSQESKSGVRNGRKRGKKLQLATKMTSAAETGEKKEKKH